ncbi:MAG: hypothetical protein NT091_04815, partial [Candidatus Falkowbacteria bacterium]|nr:hypothetical protein [Candidatus Falkowbacteria bacterium]
GNATITSTTTTKDLSVTATTTTGNLEVTGNSKFNNSLDELKGFADGAISNEVSLVATSTNGTSVELTIEKQGGGDLNVIRDGLINIFDATPKASVTLFTGTDTSPVLNYVYIDSGMTLHVDTAGFPTNSFYAPVATVLVESPATLKTKGAYKMQSWVDHVRNTYDGHLVHVDQWIREQHATWLSGVAITTTPGVGGGGGTVQFATASGEVAQAHTKVFPAFSNTDLKYVVNFSGQSYKQLTNLGQIISDSTGNTLSSRYYSLVVWGAVNENSSDTKLFINVPGGSYNKQSQSEEDPQKFSNYNIPQVFKGAGFMIARINLKNNGATWTINSVDDLRGQLPSIFAGGTAAATTEFTDSSFMVYNDTNITKQLQFDLSGLSTATTSLITIPDKDGTMALISDVNNPAGINIPQGYTLVGDSGGSATSTNKIFIASNGYVGIASTTPSALFSVGNYFKVDAGGNLTTGDSTASHTLASSSALISGDLEVKGTSYLGGNIVVSANMISFNNASSTATNIPMTFSTGGLERIRIMNTNGNVGIGTTTPSQKLVVAGNAIVTGNLQVNGCFGPMYTATSTNPYDGNDINGYDGTNPCGTGAHVCLETEILNTMACSATMPASGAYWINGGLANSTANDCSGWKSQSASVFGKFWDSTNKKSMLTVCSNNLPYACCR